MKKFAILCGVALCLGFTSCDDMLPNPPVQENPQLPIFESAGLEISQDNIGVETPINLQELADQGLRASIGKVTKLEEFPEDFILTFEVDFSGTPDFAKSTTFTATVSDDNMIEVPAATFNSAITEVITNDPAQLTVYTRLAAYATQGTSVMRIGGSDVYYGEYTYEVIPFNADHLIEASYYLVGSFCDWDVTAAVPMVRTSDASPYDDPVFMAKLDVANAPYTWKVLPASAVQAGTLDGGFGVSPSELDYNAGSLVAADGQAMAFEETEALPYTVTINMQALTYAVNLAFDRLDVYSNGKTSRYLETSDAINFSGYARLQNTWYLSGPTAAGAVVFKQLSDYVPTVDEDGNITGEFVQTAADLETADMPAADGFYHLDVDLSKYTYKAVRVNYISLVGAFNDWDAATSIDFTPSSTFLVWNLKDVTIPVDGGVKFCVNHDWTYDFGGQNDELVAKGADIAIEAGTYDIKLNFNANPPSYTFTKK